jgi:glycosyltransferase involved in cell wall biosynthesis
VGRRGILAREWDGPIEIYHPGWLYPPGGFSINPILLFLRLLPLAASLHKRHHFDMIDAHFAFPDGIAASLLARALGIPFSVTLRGNETMHAQYPRRRRMMASALGRASAVIALSDELRQFALSVGVPNERIRIIPNGIDAETFYPRDRAGCRRKHGIPADAKIVLSAGSLIERKGHHRVMQALAELLRTGTSADLVIAGGAGREGRFADDLRNQVAALGLNEHVRFTGEVSPGDLAELMSAADVFCLASSREGWPNVIHEAMACGSPVVATRVGAVADMIPSPEYGFVVPLDDPAALESALHAALEKNWEHRKISERAHARTWGQAAKEVYDVLRDAKTVAQMRGGMVG